MATFRWTSVGLLLLLISRKNSTYLVDKKDAVKASAIVGNLLSLGQRFLAREVSTLIGPINIYKTDEVI
jgi:hypothetical protein